MDEIFEICKLVIACIARDDYGPLEARNALSRVSEADIKRVLSEYDPNNRPVMPPDSFYEQAVYTGTYRDGSGWYVDIDLWYPSGRSDLTVQLDIRKKQGQLSFIIDDLRVM